MHTFPFLCFPKCSYICFQFVFVFLNWKSCVLLQNSSHRFRITFLIEPFLQIWTFLSQQTYLFLLGHFCWRRTSMLLIMISASTSPLVHCLPFLMLTTMVMMLTKDHLWKMAEVSVKVWHCQASQGDVRRDVWDVPHPKVGSIINTSTTDPDVAWFCDKPKLPK